MEGSRRPALVDEQEFNLKEWHLRDRITRENTLSRRYSASYIRSFREESHSLRSNFTISSTASSPGYLLKDEIDPSTYSFTTALKALQARSGYVWEWLSPEEGLSLNSKWDEAERYICNPLSGEVPMECLSSKTLSGRSFRSYMAARVTMSAPLVFSAKTPSKRSNLFHHHPPPPPPPKHGVCDGAKEEEENKKIIIWEEGEEKQRNRDVGTQSTATATVTEESSSSSLVSPTSTPSIQERPIQQTQDEHPHNVDQCMMQVQVKITREEEETKRTKEGGKKKNIKTGQLCNCRQPSGCLLLSSSSWSCLWIKKRHRDKLKSPFSRSQK